MTSFVSIANTIKEFQYYLRLLTFEQEPIKKALLIILHNKSNDTTYVGIVDNPAQLYQFFSTPANHNILKKLLKSKILKEDQYDLLLPPNSNQSDSEEFDITLIVLLIRNFTTLQRPRKGWNKFPDVTEICIAAYVIRAREWRNYLNHVDARSITQQIFETKWNEGCVIIAGLKYVCDTKTLKRIPLDANVGVVLKSLNAYASTLKPELRKLQNKLKAITVCQTAQKVDIVTLRGDVIDIKNEQFDHSQSITDLKKTVADVRQNIQQEITGVQSTQKEQKKTVANLQQDVHDVLSSQMEQKETVADLQQDVHDVLSSQMEQKKTVADLQQDVHDVLSSQMEQKETVADLQQDVHDVLSSQMEQKKTMADLQQNIQVVQSTQKKENEEVADLRENMHDIQLTQKEQKEAVVSLQQNLQDVQSGQKEQNETVADLQQNMQDDQMEQNRTIADLRSKYANMEKIQFDLVNEASNLRRDLMITASTNTNTSTADPSQKTWNLHEPVSIFFGRKQLIKSIHLELKQHQQVVLTGIGGVGKTQTAAKFIQMFKDEYQKIFWISAVGLAKSLKEILCKFDCKQLILDEPSIECLADIFLSKICKGSQRTLVILDDVTKVSKDVATFIRNVKEKLSVLMTSQLTDWEDFDLVSITVPCFQEEESIDFLQKELSSASQHEISILASHLQSLPLALHQSICYIKKHKVPVQKYIEQFEACRKSILGMKIKSFTEYDKTLLTVWDMAFEKIRVESTNALLILGMMAFMDNRKINKKTFTYFDKVDEFELSEIINLLSQYSLVNERNECLEIHCLVQKVIRYRVDQKQFVEDESPLRFLEEVLLKVEQSQKHLLINADYEDIWYIHVVHLFLNGFISKFKFDYLFLFDIAIGRVDTRNLYLISKYILSKVEEQYRVNRDINLFYQMLCVHIRFISSVISLGLVDVNSLIAFEKEYSTELQQKVTVVYEWKLIQAQIYNSYGKLSLSNAMIQNLYADLIKENGFDNIKLRVAMVYKTETLLNSVCERNLSDIEILDYYSAKCSLYIGMKSFDLADKIMNKWLKCLQKTSPVKALHCNYIIKRCFLLYKKGSYNEALLACDEIERIMANFEIENTLNKALILIKIKKFDEAETLFDSHNNLRLNHNHALLVLSFLKFWKHDFNAVIEMLTNVDVEDVQNILYLVKEYSKLYHDMLKDNKSKEMVKKCVQMKKYINKCFESYMDGIEF